MESDQSKDMGASTDTETLLRDAIQAHRELSAAMWAIPDPPCFWCQGDHWPIHCPVRHPSEVTGK